MTEVQPKAHGTARGTVPGLGAADWLSLAAAPTFAVMALATALLGSGSTDSMCPAPGHAAVLTGMVPMYLLMAAFHVAPWLRLPVGLTRK